MNGAARDESRFSYGRIKYFLKSLAVSQKLYTFAKILLSNKNNDA